MTTADCCPPDEDMHAARLTASSNQQLCRWYYRSGSCRTPKCSLNHVRAPAADVGAHASYDERLWSLSSTEEDEPEPGQQSWRFSVASYNILADKYARHYRSYLYDGVPHTWLEWHHRRAAILAELTWLLPDIICLQEVDRYEDLEEELGHLGYSGIYLQRDGGRRDGCATFWRAALLRPAVVRQVRFSHHDLKDNVALLVLFEPCHSTAQHDMLPGDSSAAAAGAAGAEQQQQQGEPQQLDEGFEPPQQPDNSSSNGGSSGLSQWLPKGWLWSSNGAAGSSGSRARSSQLLLRPAHGSHSDGTAGAGGAVVGSPGSLYQVPTQLRAPQQQQQGGRSSFEAGNGSPAAQQQQQPRGGNSSGRDRRPGQQHRRSGSSGRRQSLERHMQGPAGPQDRYSPHAASRQQQQQQQQAPPEWARCALLVANTHIIFTPDKGEVKLGQARLLVQEVDAMAQWYLQQQQQQQQQQQGTAPPAPAAAGGRDASGSSGSSGGSAAVLPSSSTAVAAILTGDFNATPHSPLYSYMAGATLDLQTLNKRNVSHMVGGSSSSHSSSHHKGYRAYRRAQASRRRSAEFLQQQQEAAAAAAGYQPQQQQQQQHSQGLQAVAASAVAAAGAAAGQEGAAGGTPGLQQQQPLSQQDGSGSTSSTSWRASSTPQAAATAAVDIPAGRSGAATSSSNDSSTLQRQDSSGGNGSSFVPGSSPAGVGGVGGASPPVQRQGSGGSSGRHYRWTDRDVRRAAGMSYDELVEASLSLLSTGSDSEDSSSSSPADTLNTTATTTQPQPGGDPVGRAAAAFAATAAAGSGAAAAATAAAAAAAGGQAGAGGGLLGSSPLKGWFGGGGLSRGQSGPGQPLLLQHGLKLQSSYRRVLGQEPDYTSSHSQFMDTCDYIWYTATPLTVTPPSPPLKHPQQQQQKQQATTAANGTPSTGSTSSSTLAAGTVAGDEYELRPVAVLQPPDGMRLPKGLPSRSLGSDHICLLTDFELRLKHKGQGGRQG